MALLDTIDWSPLPTKRIGPAQLVSLGIPQHRSFGHKNLLAGGMVAGSFLVMASAGIHITLWTLLYRAVPIIGELFIAQSIAGLIIGLALIFVSRLGTVAAGIGYMAASIGGLLSSTIGDGLFGFKDGFSAPWAKLTMGLEITGLLILSAVAIGMLASLRKSQ